MIFGERPLGKVLVALLCGFSLFAAFPVAVKFGICAFLALFLLHTFFRRIAKATAGLRVPILFAIIGILLSAVYFDFYFSASAYFDSKNTVTATVIDADDTASYKRVLTLQTSEIGEKTCRYRLRCDLYYGDDSLTDGSFTVKDIQVGDELTLSATLENFGESSSGFNFDNYYLTKGISAYADVHAVFSRTEGQRKILSYRLKEYRLSICDLIEERAGSAAGGFLSAVLLGEKSRMSDSLQHDFERLGISHLLALSGMHLAILTGILAKLLSLFHIGKKGKYVLMILFSILFTALTGCSPSVLRAAIMISVSCLLFLLGHTHDSFTSLAIAVVLILIFSPYAARSVGLWLSAFSCFGIIFGSRLMTMDNDQKEHEAKSRAEKPITGKLRKPFYAVRNTVYISCFAILSTVIFTSTVFGKISLLSAITTPAFSLLLEGYLIVGTIMLALGGFLPIGKVLRYFYFGIRWLCEKLSDIRGIYVSSSSAVCLVLAVVIAVLFIVFLFIRIKKPAAVLALFFALTIVFYGAAFLDSETHRKRETVLYLTNGIGEYILTNTQGKTIAIDFSNQNASSAYDFSAMLNDEHLTEVDVYLFSAYTYGTPNALRALLSEVTVRKVVFPEPKNDDESAILKTLLEILAEFRSQTDLYEERESLAVGEYSFIELYREEYGVGKRVIFTFLDEERIYTYLSSGVLEGDTKTVAEPLIEVSNTLICGCHGSEYEYYHKLEELPSSLENLVIVNRHIALGESAIGVCKTVYYPERYVIR